MKKLSIVFTAIAAFAIAVVSMSCGKQGQSNPSEESISVTPGTLSFSAAEQSLDVSVKSTADWTVTVPDWIIPGATSGKGTGSALKVSLKAVANTGDARQGEVVFSTKSGKVARVSVSQEGGKPGPEPGFKGGKFLVCANSMVYYGGFVQKGSSGQQDMGMFYKLMKANGYDVTVIDCTEGGHYLSDYINSCHTCTKGDHLAGLDLGSFDYVILSEAGSNVSAFLDNCRAVYKRVTDKNPKAKKIYINHVYSVYKKHGNILNNLKTLHDVDGVTIVNCGQLAYDIYTGAVKVPGGSLTYSDRYTFCNHTDSDTYHPNPLMGYIMTQMTYCALTGKDASYADYSNLIKGCSFGSGSVSYSAYYSKYYTVSAFRPFMDVIDNPAEMKGIQQLIPQYVNKF